MNCMRKGGFIYEYVTLQIYFIFVSFHFILLAIKHTKNIRELQHGNSKQNTAGIKKAALAFVVATKITQHNCIIQWIKTRH